MTVHKKFTELFIAKKHILKMMKAGIIERMDDDRGDYWKIVEKP